MANHPIVHIELSANNREQAAKFYQDIFGWEVKQIPEMNYATFVAGEGDKKQDGGFNPVEEGNSAGTVRVYVDTSNIRETLRQIESCGGKVVSQPEEIPGVGLFALFQDPTGNTLGLLEAAPQM